MDILSAIRLLRTAADAIRSRDLQRIVDVVYRLADAVGLEREIDALKQLSASIQARNLDDTIVAMHNVLHVIADRLGVPLPHRYVNTEDTPGIDMITAGHLESEAAHWEVHCGLRAGMGAGDGDKLDPEKTPTLKQAVNPAVILSIIEAVLLVLRHWRRSAPAQAQAPAPEPKQAPAPSQVPEPKQAPAPTPKQK